MSYDIEIDSNNKIIKVNVTGLLNQDVRKEILLALAIQLEVINFSRVIIDVTESTFNPAEPILGALELTNFMRSIGIKSHVKIAFIYSEAENHRKYFENVAQLDGFNLKYFKNLDEASEWLK